MRLTRFISPSTHPKENKTTHPKPDDVGDISRLSTLSRLEGIDDTDLLALVDMSVTITAEPLLGLGAGQAGTPVVRLLCWIRERGTVSGRRRA